ncbi:MULTISPECIES: ABC transporter permease [Arthrobacter]|uniref:ABC transporter permease n=1 Tax=Arthrobacter terricola TaxID=2547396 RepID=A0A4R5KNT1_9MICC|nr:MULTISPECIES: ABC transporter permease [Arthrobacter]MBT8160941.1 ABC transporter permease [Arthrobacter sp. GN70]TDF97311.1 ABC transporter permease [Arthrobacter terricola]
MSTATVSKKHAGPSAGTHGVNFFRVLNSESIKFRTLMSTKLLMCLTFVAIVGIGFLSALVRWNFINQMVTVGRQGHKESVQQAVQSFPAGSGFDLYNLPNAGLNIGILIMGSLAVLFIASEYATGMIRSTMNAAPDRLSTFGAKALVLVVVSYVLSIVGGVVTFLIASPMFANFDLGLGWNTDGVIYSVFTGGLYVSGVALIGLSLGTLLKNPAGGITILVGIMFVLPFAGQFLAFAPGDFWKYVPQYLPSEAAGRFLSIGHVDGTLDPWAGGLVFLGYVILFMVPALIALKKRDV